MIELDATTTFISQIGEVITTLSPAVVLGLAILFKDEIGAKIRGSSRANQTDQPMRRRTDDVILKSEILNGGYKVINTKLDKIEGELNKLRTDIEKVDERRREDVGEIYKDIKEINNEIKEIIKGL